jgi:hypothetical protein
MREEAAEVFVQPHKNVLDFAAAGAEFVADVINGRVADGEKIGSGGFAEIQGIDGFFGEFRQGGIGVGARRPLLVKGAVWFTDS